MCKTRSGDWLPRRKYIIFPFEFPVDMPLVHPKAVYFKVTNIVKLKINKKPYKLIQSRNPVVVLLVHSLLRYIALSRD